MRRSWRTWSVLGALFALSHSVRAQSTDSLPTKRWSLEGFVSAGAAVWSQPIASSRVSSVPAGGGGFAISHVHSARWRGSLAIDDVKRGSDGFNWRFRTRYTELSAMVYRRLFDVGPTTVSLGAGPAIAWPREGKAIYGEPAFYVQRLDLSPQEYHARMALEARTNMRIPIAGRISFQRGINRVLHSYPSASRSWDGQTPPYNKLLAFEVGATLIKW